MSMKQTLFSRRKMQGSPTLLLIKSTSSTPEPSPVARSVSPSKGSSRTSSTKSDTPIHKRLAQLRAIQDEINDTKCQIEPIHVVVKKSIET